MPNPFAAAGAVPDRQSKWAPLYVNRFFTGLYSNSNPLSEAAVPFLYQKFYSGSRYETLRGGVNVEVSPRLTLIRRPGNSVYNSQSFLRINSFYSFRIFNQQTGANQIIVIADTVNNSGGSANVYDATGPSNKNVLFTKVDGDLQTTFQSVGNTLYAGDGADLWKYMWFPQWQSSATYSVGDIVTDANGNIQKCIGAQFMTNTIQDVTVASNVLTIHYFPTVTYGQAQSIIGASMIFADVGTATFLNGQMILITGTGSSNFQAVGPINHADYALAADTGTFFINQGSGLSGSSSPPWLFAIGGLVTDASLVWQNKGPAVQNWGIVAPTIAPTVGNSLFSTGNAWAASTYFWAGQPLILDSNGNIQLLTTGGTTSTVPSWATSLGATTTDGGAVWTNEGSGTRGTLTPYSPIGVGASTIAVTVTTTVVTQTQRPGKPINGAPQTFNTYTKVTSYYFFTCTTQGTTSATPTSSITWPTNLGGTITDGTVVWTNCGYQVTRVNSSTISPTSSAKGNVSNSQAVSPSTSINDSAGSGGGKGYIQSVTLSGKSGSSAPTWTTVAGQATTDGGVIWTNGGTSGAANTLSWVYGYSFENSVSEEESSVSPLTAPIFLQANSAISVSGNGDPNYAADGTDTINLYRSVGGNTSPVFLLTSFPAPAGGASWSYVDASPDPPAPGAILNVFIEGDTIGNNAPPPAGLTNLSYYLNRIFGNVGPIGYYSGVSNQAVGSGVSSFPGLNFYQMPEAISQQWASATGLLIFTVHGVDLSQGVDANGNPNTPIRLLEDIGLLSPNLFTVNGSLPTLFTSDRQLLTLDPSSGVNRVSDPIADLLAQYSNSTSYLAWHVNGTDSAYFLADGNTGWYRLAPTAAPETGQSWSVNAQIVGGVGCVKSIETTPGNKQLLLGPSVNGPILARDLTTNADNSSAYAANVVIGSLVFAQHNQCAEIESITTTCKALGSHPAVSILGDEISGTFELLQTAVTDPPFLGIPISLYSDRWYFSQLQQTAWMRHCQIEIAWPAENVADEILEYSIFGCVHSEG